jgi:hypothetical protein
MKVACMLIKIQMGLVETATIYALDLVNAVDRCMMWMAP